MQKEVTKCCLSFIGGVVTELVCNNCRPTLRMDTVLKEEGNKHDHILSSLVTMSKGS